jgi:hypothetical protein
MLVFVMAFTLTLTFKAHPSKADGTNEALVNGGFESGDLTGWDVGVAGNGSEAIVTTNPYSGQYCLCLTGLHGVHQYFQGIPTSRVQSVTFCERSEQSISLGVDLFYSDSSVGYGSLWGYANSSWSFFDVTPHVETGKILVGIGLNGWTFNGTPMNTYYDDVSILYTLPAAYNVTVSAHCNIEGTDVSVGVAEDGSPTGFNTPHIFSELNGSHTFSVPIMDAAGDPFVQWSTGENTTTIAVLDGGTYTAYYGAPLGTVIRVPEEFKSVQEAVDAAAPESTITIGPGVYNESIVINKNLTIIGRLGSEPVFNGGGSGIAITLLQGASGSVITGIMITSWNQGILIDNASDCKIYNNIMSLLSSNGIVVQGASAVNNQVYGNMFQNSAVAVDVSSSSTSNNVSKNIICLSNIALKIEGSQNIVCENMILNDQVGLSIVNSNGNVVYHNDFVNNTVQVTVSASTGNAWDNGYPSGGNYWSDHTGPDEYSGVSQNELGADGIVDTQYTVATGQVDRYPLVQPFNVHDIGIGDYSMLKTVVGKGYSVSVEVKILNYGVSDETCVVTAYANESAASVQTAKLIKSNCTILILTWNTSGFAYGNYSVCACVGPVQGETDISDNNCTCQNPVHVGVPGDVSSSKPGVYDGTVNMKDIAYMVALFNTKPGYATFNPNADVNDDSVCNMKDIAIAILNFNKRE